MDFAAAAWGCVDWLAVVKELRKVFSCLLKPEAKKVCVVIAAQENVWVQV